MVRPLIRHLTVLLLLAFFGSVHLFAQQSGRISGKVTDQQGAAVGGATVQVVNQEIQSKLETKTDGAGAYSAPNLPPGDYKVLVQAEGFNNSSSDVLPLAAEQALVFNVQLVVAATQTEVTVEGAGAQIELDNATLSGTLSEHEVTSYGLNGRNFSQLITLTPGVSNQTGQDEAKVGVAGSAKFSVNGGRVEYNTFEVDGSDVLNTSINASRGQGEPLMVYPSVDAIQEMQVLTSNYGAEYGKSASGSVLVSTKSGTAKFHGNAYGFIRNEKFNARNYFDAPGRTPLYRRQDYGGTIGGPIYIPNHYNTGKDKTYFFWSEELRLEKTPVDYNQAVPTVAERSGDFSDVCPYEPTGTPATPSGDCPNTTPPGNAPLSTEHVNISYLSGALLNTNLIPLPNSMGGCNTTNTTSFNNCYVAAVSPATYWREELFRIDHNLTPSVQVSFRYIHDTWHTDTLTPQWGIVQNSFPTVENHLVGPGLNMVLSSAQTLPHAFLNRVAFSYAVEHISLTPQPGPGIASLARPQVLDNPTGSVPPSSSCATVPGLTPSPGQTVQQLSECPIGSIFNNGYGGNKMPGLVFQGNNGAYGGHGFAVDTGYAPWNQANPTYTLRDDVSKSIGNHTLQFGFEATVVQQNELSAVSGANSGDLQGLLTFSNQQSRYTTGNAFADFLGGAGISRLVVAGGTSQVETTDGTTTAIKSFTQDSGQGKYYNRYNSADLYLQDDWRVNPRLTLNLGFRASLFGAWYNAKGTAYNWEPQVYSQSLGDSIYIDPTYGELVNTTGTGSGAGSLPIVPLPSNLNYNLTNLDRRITNGLVQCGKNGVPRSCMTNRLFNPAPRIGLAWDPTGSGRSSIRAGYGLFWEHGTGYEANTGSLIGSAPLILSETQSSFPGSTFLPNDYNTIGQVQLGNATSTSFTSGATFPLNVTSIPTKAVYSYTQQWSLSVQRELRKDLVGSLAYVGTKGTHLTATRDLNQLPALAPGLNPFPAGQPMTNDICTVGAGVTGAFPVNGSNVNTGTTSSAGIGPGQPGYKNAFVACTGSPGFVAAGIGASADTLRPYTGFSNIISIENIADSQYHALQGTLRRSKGPLTLGVAYTYSHSLDDASDRASANFADSLNLKSNWASSDFDQRHLINVSYIYDLPFLRLLYNFTHFINEQDADEQDDGAPRAAPASKPSANAKWQVGPVWKTLLDGWQLSGIAIYQSGSPFSVINGGSQTGGPGITAISGAPAPNGPVSMADNAGVGDGLGIGSFADRAPSPHGTKPVVPSNTRNNIGPLLKNPLLFVAPRGLTFGDSGRNSMNNPARTNFNMSLLKHFKAFGERDVEFRAEAYNVFNHTQFRIYDPSHPGNTGNNVINCYGDVSTGYSAGASSCLAGNSFLHPVDAHDPRILQFGLKLAY
jgi:hypothetical protein